MKIIVVFKDGSSDCIEFKQATYINNVLSVVSINGYLYTYDLTEIKEVEINGCIVKEGDKNDI